MKCDHCGEEKASVRRRRQRTQYVNDEENFAVFCDECQKEADEYWDERWAEYYAGCL